MTGRVQSFVYDGTFDLSFLLDDETVSSAGDGTGDCWITADLGWGRERGTRVRLGQTVVRLSNGSAVAYDDKKGP